ncbi:hypothetical protein HYQ00_gp28 [Arthrobacter phage TripleJ]|uniref:Uncharacterized protein n=1 Tax=Arthrobacter phage TripleJ TaxID=2599838 RepID=A0A5J6TLH0_9CAUD|nr:hypothetical protein HYQ00_gp28 [Arthrobacter phage TripleJ]QFG09572.1 hypothetical protein PBI_TRIPLEJ_28 [Arthrobacter phage TripleJ]
MPKRNWVDGVLGNTPLNAARLNDLEEDLEAALLQLARDPSQLFTGTVTRDGDGAATSATIEWPDGVAGIYSGTASSEFPGAIDAYTLTRTGSPVLTFTQPAVTRDAAGNVTNRPPITVS